ncbi:MAG TPA: ATP-binding protein [Roseiflexaceae bacterium]|nr:ATP-binding protein [Roseiflexaceae bacterium]
MADHHALRRIAWTDKMSIASPLRLSVRAKVLLLTLGLALPPLFVVSFLGLAALDRARDTAVQVGTGALRSQAEANLAKRAADKARLYNAQLDNVRQEVEAVAAYATVLIDAGPAPAAEGRVWIAPDGPTPASERQHAAAVNRARQFIPLIRSVAQRNQLVSLGYIGLEQGGVVAFDKDIIDILDQIKPFDVRQRSWYIAARDAGRTVWVDTYVDANTKKLTTTCATPLYDAQENFVGVAGFDVLLDTIRDDVLQLDMEGLGTAFLINEQGEVLVRSGMRADGLKWNEPFNGENLLETPDEKLRAVVERMVRREQGVERLFFQGGNVYLAFAPIDSAGWSVGIVVPEDEIVRPARDVDTLIGRRQSELQNQVLLVLALFMVAVPVLGVLLSRLMVAPLRRLQAGAHRIAAGDLSMRMPPAGADEIGDLVRSFNLMTDSLAQKVAELEENVSQLAGLNQVSNRFRAILSLPELLAEVPRGVCESFGFERAALYLLDGNTLRAVSAYFGPGAEEHAAQFIAAANAVPITLDSETVEADIVRTRQAVIVDNPWDHPRVVQAKQQVDKSESYVQVPIFGREERIIGLLSADYFYSRRPITARDAAQLMTYASMVGLTIENTRLYNELERQVAQRTRELRAALERAQQADRLKGQFLAAISHELRTPLNAIIGFSTVMLDELDGPISPMQREDLKTINRNGRFLLHLINDLLDLARIEAGRLDLELRPVDMRPLIADVAETVQGLLHNKDVQLRLSLPPRLPRAYADVAKVRQVLLNLLANAVKFTDRGSIAVSAQCVVIAGEQQAAPASNGRARSVLARDGRRVTPFIAVTVRDTGVGIAPEDLPLIFEEFHQVHDLQREKRGSGLGLAISRKLIEAHGGRIWVESTVGQGSSFTFTLPCYLEVANRPAAMGDRAAESAVSA